MKGIIFILNPALCGTHSLVMCRGYVLSEFHACKISPLHHRFLIKEAMQATLSFRSLERNELIVDQRHIQH